MAKKYSVGAIFVRLLDDNDAPKTIADVVLESVLGDKDITREYMMLDAANLSYQAEQFYEYGRDYFTYGLPTGIFLHEDYIAHAPPWNDVNQDSDIKTVIESIEGEAITVIAREIGEDPDELTEAYKYMYHYLGYNSTTNRCKSNLVSSEFDDDVIVEFDYAEFINSEGLEITFTVTPDANVPGTTYQMTVEYYGISIILNSPLYKVQYTKVGSTQEYWWTYSPSQREHPLLGSVIYYQTSRTFFPFAPVRIDTYNINADTVKPQQGQQSPYQLKPSKLSETSTLLLNKLNININELTDGIMTNENVDQITDAYVTLAVPINTESPEQILYLYEFFKAEIDRQRYTKAEFDDWYADSGSWGNGALATEIFIYDTHVQSEANLQNRLHYHYIENVLKSGSIGAINHATTELVQGVIEGGNTRYIDHSLVIIRRQISANEYMELTIKGLYSSGSINVIPTPIGEPRNSKSKRIRTNIPSVLAGETGTSLLYIPMSHDTLNGDVLTGANMSSIRNTIIHKSLVLLIQSVQVTHLKWYETAEFAAFLKILAIVIAVVTWNPWAIPGIVAGTWAAAAWIIAQLAIQYILMLLVSKAILWVVEKIGGKYALILAVVVAIVAAAYGYSGVDLGAYMPSAEAMLQAVNAITSAVTENAYNEMVELQREAEDFLKSAEEKQEELDAAEDLLFSDIDYDLLNIIVNPPVILDESPDQFFNRTIHIGNPGVLSLNAPNDFVSNLLTLPDNLIT